MKRRFRWNSWNESHIALHGVSEAEVEWIVQHAARPFPRKVADSRYLVRGSTPAGRWLQVSYLVESDDEWDYDQMTLDDIVAMQEDDLPRIYVIHARELTARERAKTRRLGQ